MAIADFSLSWFGFWLALCLRLEDLVLPTINQAVVFTVVSILLVVSISLGQHYNAIYRYLGLRSLFALLVTVGTFFIVFALFTSLRIFPEIPKSLAVLYPLITLLLLCTIRLIARFLLVGIGTGGDARSTNRAYIYGAGEAGRQLSLALTAVREIQVVGFIDDESGKHGQYINGIKILAPQQAIEVREKLGVTDLLLAVPSLSRAQRRAIVDKFSNQQLKIKTLPGVAALAKGGVSAEDLTEIKLEDLLGRDPSQPDIKLLDRCIKDKVVMVTGAGGSIGSELCRQILAIGPKRLVLVEQSEYALYQIDLELRSLASQSNLSVPIDAIMLDVKDTIRVARLLEEKSVESIYHAAAYKHVPLVEANPFVAIETNVFGTLNLVQAAEKQGVQNFVLISTDKAVRPTNVMGATKRVAEMILQARANVSGKEQKSTRFTMVRFGNVLGSSGSVVPLFKKQIKAGGPLTLTHEEVTRYFMTIPEAAQLVLQAGSMGTGGDVFVLDMGKPVKIMDLAKRVIALSGKSLKSPENPTGDIEISVTGLRPGEKKFEELLIGDNPVGTEHPRIWKAFEDRLEWDALSESLDLLRSSAHEGDAKKAKQVLAELVAGYTTQT